MGEFDPISKGMKFIALTAALLATPALADTTVADWRAAPDMPIAATGVDLADFKWQARPLVVFADSPLNPAFQEQMELLTAQIDDIVDRDILVIVDTDPSAQSALRQTLRPSGFMLVLIGKDGGVKLRKPFPWDVREISRVIDKMPMRKREIEERQTNAMFGDN